MVVWESAGSADTDTSLSIQGQRYDASGSPLGDSFQINAYTTSEREVPLSRAIPRGLGQVALGFSIFESRPTALEAPLSYAWIPPETSIRWAVTKRFPSLTSAVIAPAMSSATA